MSVCYKGAPCEMVTKFTYGEECRELCLLLQQGVTPAIVRIFLKYLPRLSYKSPSFFQQLVRAFQLRIYMSLDLYDLVHVVNVVRKYGGRTKEWLFEGWGRKEEEQIGSLSIWIVTRRSFVLSSGRILDNLVMWRQLLCVWWHQWENHLKKEWMSWSSWLCFFSEA